MPYFLISTGFGISKYYGIHIGKEKQDPSVSADLVEEEDI